MYIYESTPPLQCENGVELVEHTYMHTYVWLFSFISLLPFVICLNTYTHMYVHINVLERVKNQQRNVSYLTQLCNAKY